MIKNKRDEAIKKKGDQQKDKTYAAVTKLQSDIPRMVDSRQETVLNLNIVGSFQVMVIIIQAHLANMAKPGSFGRTLRELLRLNNLPDVVVPDDAPSCEIFGAINGLTGTQMPKVYTQPPEGQVQQRPQMDTDDKEIDVTVGTCENQSRPVNKSDKQTLQHNTESLAIASALDIPPMPMNSPERARASQEHIPTNLEVRFIASAEDKVPVTLATRDLLSAIDNGRVKSMYRGPNLPEDSIMKLIREGRRNTTTTPIKKVEKPVFKKARNG